MYNMSIVSKLSRRNHHFVGLILSNFFSVITTVRLPVQLLLLLLSGGGGTAPAAAASTCYGCCCCCCCCWVWLSCITVRAALACSRQWVRELVGGAGVPQGGVGGDATVIVRRRRRNTSARLGGVTAPLHHEAILGLLLPRMVPPFVATG